MSHNDQELSNLVADAVVARLSKKMGTMIAKMDNLMSLLNSGTPGTSSERGEHVIFEMETFVNECISMSELSPWQGRSDEHQPLGPAAKPDFATTVAQTPFAVSQGYRKAKVPVGPAPEEQVVQSYRGQSMYEPRALGKKSPTEFSQTVKNTTTNIGEVEKLRMDRAGVSAKLTQYEQEMEEQERKKYGCLGEWARREEPRRTGCLAEVVQSVTFDRLSFLVIAINIAFTIYATNERMRRLDLGQPDWLEDVDSVFLVIYTLELIVKFIVHRQWIFCNHDSTWNLFDFGIIVTAWMEKALVLAFDEVDGTWTFLRIYRVIKVSRILRVFRAFRFLEELKLMVNCVLGSFLSLFWSGVFLLLVLLIASLTFVQAMTQYQVDNLGVVSATERETINEHFGSVGITMINLFQCTTGGRDWFESYDLLVKTGPLYACMFMLYIFFVTFALLNIVISIFMDRAIKLAQPDEDAKIVQKRREQMRQAHEMKAFLKASAEHEETLTFDDLQRALNDEEFCEFLEIHLFSTNDLQAFFTMMARTMETDCVDMDSFVVGVTQMKGYATSIDVQLLMFQVQELQSVVDSRAKD